MTSAVAEAEGKSQEIEEKVQRFFDIVNDTISWVPWPASELLGPIEDGMENLAQEMQKFWDEVNQIFEQPGDADRLRQAGVAWADSIGNPLGDTAGDISLENHKTNIEWTGRAAEAYKALVPAQEEALSGLKDIAITMRTSLDDMAESIEDFWQAIVMAFVSFIVGAVAAIASAFGVVTIPAGIAVLLGAVGVGLALIFQAVQAIDSHMDVIRDQQTAVQQGLRDVGTKWEQSNIAAMSDASVTDGDASDWRPFP